MNTCWLVKKKADRKSRLAQYDRGERGPIEEFAVDSSDEESEDDDSDENEDDDSDNGFVVDDDIIDGFRVENSKAMMELPRKLHNSKGVAESSDETDWLYCCV